MLLDFLIVLIIPKNQIPIHSILIHRFFFYKDTLRQNFKGEIFEIYFALDKICAADSIFEVLADSVV